MGLKPGNIFASRVGLFAPEWAESMAKAMEDAFLQEWPIAMPDQEKPALNDQMRLLFVAISQGVINHLAANPDAFVISNSSENGNAPLHTHTATTSLTVDPLL